MSKPTFKYSKGDVLKMPGHNGAPGKVRSRLDHDDREPDYFVEGMPGPMRMPSAYFTESSLSSANPPIEVPPAHVVAAAKKKRRR